MDAKKKAIQNLREEISKCNKCLKKSEKELVNALRNNNNTPVGIGYWSDAFPNYNAKLMIVGQDFGSVTYVESLFKNIDSIKKKYGGFWEPRSSTWRNLMKYLKEADFDFNDIYLTNAVLCLRSGDMQNDRNIPKESFDNCFAFLEKQIDIVQPKVIATLGKNVFELFNQKYSVTIKKKTFSEIAGKGYKIESNSVLFPLYHTSSRANNMRGTTLMLRDFKNLIMLQKIESI